MKTLKYKLPRGTHPSNLGVVKDSLTSVGLTYKFSQAEMPLEYNLNIDVPNEKFENIQYMFELGALIGGAIAQSFM